MLRPAPLHILTRQVKALKCFKPAPVTAHERELARNALGMSFGTKKAQARIRADERNKVDVAAMEGVMNHLMDRVEKGTENLPSQGMCLYSYCVHLDRDSLQTNYERVLTPPG